MRLATSATIHQSGFASPGGGRKARWREMRRSELVTLPSFSPQAAAGRRTWAWTAVSVPAVTSDTTRNSQAFRAATTASASGRLTAGLVAMTHRALMRPSATARNNSTALRPGFPARCDAPQKRPTRSRASASKSMWAAS